MGGLWLTGGHRATRTTALGRRASNAAGRNASEPGAGPERAVASADPTLTRGRPLCSEARQPPRFRASCRGRGVARRDRARCNTGGPPRRGSRRPSTTPEVLPIGASHAQLAYGEAPEYALSSVQRKVTWEVLTDWDRQFYQDSAAKVRDDSIAANIRKLAQRYPGQRIAVLIGGAHLYPQRARLEQYQEVRWLPAHGFLPSDDEVQRALTPADAKLLLGANLDSWVVPAMPQSRDHRRSKQLLDFLGVAGA